MQGMKTVATWYWSMTLKIAGGEVSVTAIEIVQEDFNQFCVLARPWNFKLHL